MDIITPSPPRPQLWTPTRMPLKLTRAPLLPGQHQSVSDWDFLIRSNWSVTTAWELSALIYVSPPSCLLMRPTSSEVYIYALHNAASTQNLTAGSIRGYHRFWYGSSGHSSYHIGVTGVGSLGIYFVADGPTTSWAHQRWDFWQGFNPTMDPATIVDHYNWVAGAWSFLTRTYHTPLSGATNRVGIGVWTSGTIRRHFFDDTEIWLAV